MPVGHRRRRREACWTAASTAASSPQKDAMCQKPAPFMRGSPPPPTLRAARPSLLIDDDADDHLVQMRPIILGVTAFTERGATLTLEIDRGGVHEHHGEIAEQRPSAGEQPLPPEILHTTCDERAVGLIGRRQLLAEPGHGAVEMM